MASMCLMVFLLSRNGLYMLLLARMTFTIMLRKVRAFALISNLSVLALIRAYCYSLYRHPHTSDCRSQHLMSFTTLFTIQTHTVLMEVFELVQAPSVSPGHNVKELRFKPLGPNKRWLNRPTGSWPNATWRRIKSSSKVRKRMTSMTPTKRGRRSLRWHP
ncbi:uncharacterized protein YALI1_D09382g [Yarrowia lipolytica]|uniref:Uncharacterized protein n=1 Tax=Yarrowia lipolytica TaxID=4952 RepID=A0A1D8NDM0_YARLL|nr:hypothetical protein YALI1_D09382g [Yarrowia lipolytica]